MKAVLTCMKAGRSSVILLLSCCALESAYLATGQTTGAEIDILAKNEEFGCTIEDRTIYSQCGSACPRTCQNFYDDSSTTCILVCVEGCVCVLEGAVMNENTGKCVIPRECPPYIVPDGDTCLISLGPGAVDRVCSSTTICLNEELGYLPLDGSAIADGAGVCGHRSTRVRRQNPTKRIARTRANGARECYTKCDALGIACTAWEYRDRGEGRRGICHLFTSPPGTTPAFKPSSPDWVCAVNHIAL